MGKKSKIVFLILLGLLAVAIFVFLLSANNVPVLNPQGIIADKQKDLLVISTLLMLIVIVPVYVLVISFAWRYRASNKKAKYSPNFDHNIVAETIWWGIPIIIITILGGIIWTSSHELDPFRSLDSDTKPVTIQVIALQWKWLFIYPNEKIATVNYIRFPQNTPVNFKITSDAPMNSFWIPSLGGQVYAMSGMETKLHLMANDIGTYRGSSANLSGDGFAGMTFKAHSTSRGDFDSWVTDTKKSKQLLDKTTYDKLAEPSKNNKEAFYKLKDTDLYDTVMMKYMAPSTDNKMEGMHH